jgi:hypothetical protein
MREAAQKTRPRLVLAVANTDGMVACQTVVVATLANNYLDTGKIDIMSLFLSLSEILNSEEWPARYVTDGLS